MQVQKISFTSQEYPQKDSALYSKKGYMNLLASSQFMTGALATYGICEAIDKFQLIKNRNNRTPKQLKTIAWKHTKYNLLIGIAAGIGSVLMGKYFTNKYLMPMNEKVADWADKQERISAKAKELVEQEEFQKAAPAKIETKEEDKKEDTKEVKEEESKKTTDQK